MFTVFIRRMSFSGENNLYGFPGIQQNGLDAVQIMKDHRRPLVPGKSARKSNRESVGIQQRSHRNHLARIDMILCPPGSRTLTREREELSFQEQMNIPEFLVRNIHDAIPE